MRTPSENSSRGIETWTEHVDRQAQEIRVWRMPHNRYPDTEYGGDDHRIAKYGR